MSHTAPVPTFLDLEITEARVPVMKERLDGHYVTRADYEALVEHHKKVDAIAVSLAKQLAYEADED